MIMSLSINILFVEIARPCTRLIVVLLYSFAFVISAVLMSCLKLQVKENEIYLLNIVPTDRFGHEIDQLY